MKISRHALKKIDLLFPGLRERNELEFIRTHIIDGVYPLAWKSGLNRKDTIEFCSRCHKFDIEILGIEIHPDSPYPCYVFNYEDYCKSEYSCLWIEKPLEELQNVGINGFIIPVVHVPTSILRSSR